MQGNVWKIARKRKSWTSLNFSFKLNTFYLASILFTRLKFTCVNVRSQKRVSGNQPLSESLHPPLNANVMKQKRIVWVGQDNERVRIKWKYSGMLLSFFKLYSLRADSILTVSGNLVVGATSAQRKVIFHTSELVWRLKIYTNRFTFTWTVSTVYFYTINRDIPSEWISCNPLEYYLRKVLSCS